MKISGGATLRVPAERVWQALQDPAVLVRTIPGCQELEMTGPDAYRATVHAGVASIRGIYSGEVRLTDQCAPTSFVLRASGQGVPGTVRADVTVRLCEDGPEATRLEYDADAVIGGMIGGVGQRMLAAVAKRTAGEFFAAVEDVLTRAPAVPLVAPSPTPAPVVSPPPLPEPATATPAAAAPGATWTAPAPPSTAGTQVGATDVATVAAATFLGAVAALVGVALGWTLSRRSRS